MIDVNVIELENNKEYIVADTIVCDNNNYLLLINKENKNDIVIRKVIKKDNTEYTVKLDSEDEFTKVLSIFANKHNGGSNEE